MLRKVIHFRHPPICVDQCQHLMGSSLDPCPLRFRGNGVSSSVVLLKAN